MKTDFLLQNNLLSLGRECCKIPKAYLAVKKLVLYASSKAFWYKSKRIKLYLIINYTYAFAFNPYSMIKAFVKEKLNLYEHKRKYYYSLISYN